MTSIKVNQYTVNVSSKNEPSSRAVEAVNDTVNSIMNQQKY